MLDVSSSVRGGGGGRTLAGWRVVPILFMLYGRLQCTAEVRFSLQFSILYQAVSKAVYGEL